MLGDSLSCQPKLMLHGQTATQFKERLAIALHQFVENRPARWSRYSFEHVAHGCYYRQVATCLSSGLPWGLWPIDAESQARRGKAAESLATVAPASKIVLTNDSASVAKAENSGAKY